MNTTSPAVSVIVPVYNGEPFLAEALDSITTQDYGPLQVLVVDDGSTDASAAIAARYAGVTVLQQPHGGIHAALDHGLRRAVGDYITFLDADDRWLPGKLKRQVAAMQQHPTIDLVFGQARQFTMREEAGGPTTVFSAPQPAYTKITLMARQAAFLRIGGFGASALGHDFLDWYARTQQAGLQALMLPELLAERRVHAHNHGRSHRSEQQRAYLHTLRDLVQRKRQAAKTPSHAGGAS
jgi:glycosyltransferase involved in cell wall biosynthesis